MALDQLASLKVANYYNVTDGVNLNVSEILEKTTELEGSINLTSTKLGAFSQAPFWQTFGASPIPGNTPYAGYAFKDTNDNNHRLMVQNNADNTNGVISEIIATGIITRYSNLTASTPTSFDQTFGHLFAMNEVDGLITSDNLVTWSTKNAIAAPKTKYIIQYNRDLYCYGDPNMPQRVYKSFIQDPNIQAVCYAVGDQPGPLTTLTVDDSRYVQPGMILDFVTAGTTTVYATVTVLTVPSRTTITFASNAASVADTDEVYLTTTKTTAEISILWDSLHDWFDCPSNGEQIISACVSSNRLVLCQENSTYRWDGSNNTVVDDTIGCSSHYSMITAGRFAFWFYKGNYYRYDGYVPVPISNQLLPVFINIPDYTAIISLSDRTYMRIFVYLGTLTTPQQAAGTDMWGVYDILKDKWEFRSDMNAVLGFMDDTGDGEVAMMVLNSEGQMYQIETGITLAREYLLKTKYDPQQNPILTKQYRYLAVVCTVPGGDISYSLDFNRDTYFPLGTMTKKIQIFELPESAQGVFLSAGWSGNDNGDSPDFLGYSVFYSEVGYITGS